MLSGFHKPSLAMTTDRDRLTQQECQAWYGDNVENMQHHILKHCRNVLALGATRQTSFDGNNGRTISRPIKIDRDFETNCPTHFLHTHTPRKYACMCNAQSQLGQFGSRTHRNCCCPHTNPTGNTVPDYNTATHSHTQILSLTHTHTQHTKFHKYTTKIQTKTHAKQPSMKTW